MLSENVLQSYSVRIVFKECQVRIRCRPSDHNGILTERMDCKRLNELFYDVPLNIYIILFTEVLKNKNTDLADQWGRDHSIHS